MMMKRRMKRKRKRASYPYVALGEYTSHRPLWPPRLDNHTI
jgi:hypothetical protein